LHRSSARSHARRLARAWLTAAASVALAAAGLAFAGSASAQPAQPAHSAQSARPVARSAHDGVRLLATPDYKRACPVAKPGKMACMVLVRTNVTQHAQAAITPDAAPTGVGYGPSSLQSAYVLPSSTAGSGQTVAVVDAMDDPNAASDLATYRSDWGLPACGSGCFEKVGQTGSTTSLPVPEVVGRATQKGISYLKGRAPGFSSS